MYHWHILYDLSIKFVTKKFTFELHTIYNTPIHSSLTRLIPWTWKRAVWLRSYFTNRTSTIVIWSHNRIPTYAVWLIITSLIITARNALTVWPYSACVGWTSFIWTIRYYRACSWQIQFCAAQPIIIVEEILWIRAPTTIQRFDCRLRTNITIHFLTSIVFEYKIKIITSAQRINTAGILWTWCLCGTQSNGTKYKHELDNLTTKRNMKLNIEINKVRPSPRHIATYHNDWWALTDKLWMIPFVSMLCQFIEKHFLKRGRYGQSKTQGKDRFAKQRIVLHRSDDSTSSSIKGISNF